MTQYEKGYRAERRVAQELEEAGWLVCRAAGSKGPFDLWAVKIRLIQVKATGRPRGWTGELEALEQVLASGPGISRELWVWVDRQGWEKYSV